MLSVSQDFVITRFFQYAGYPKFKKLANVYEGCCPICREGSSWGKKKRLYYLLKEDIICCHNCGWYSKPFKWIQKVSGISNIDLIKEIREFDGTLVSYKNVDQELPEPMQKDIHILPEDSINLFDPMQYNFYKDNKIVQVALDYIHSRRLDTCCNRPKTLWLSLKDKVHKNRLILPFYDFQKHIIFYQTRGLLSKDLVTRPKYLSKIGGDKSLFNIDNVREELDYIFIFEGPIDCSFVLNGVAVTGIQERSRESLNPLQKQQLDNFPLHKRVWVLDSQWRDIASYRKTKILLSQGEKVFIWPEKVGTKFKDFNEACMKLQKDSIDTNFIIKNTYTELTGKVLLSAIKQP